MGERTGKFDYQSFIRAGEILTRMNKKHPFFNEGVESGTVARLKEISSGQPGKIGEETQIVKAPTRISIKPNIYHKVLALSDIEMIEDKDEG